MTHYVQVQLALRARPRTWLVTGAAGFIGSHLVETLLRLGQNVVAMDNFATGYRRNLEEAAAPAATGRFRLVEADIRDVDACMDVCRGVDYVLHHAALGSVPRSLDDPLGVHEVNVTGTLNLLAAAREAGVARVVYASSSAVYGDCEATPAREEETGAALSPYAVTKRVNEEYAAVFARAYGVPSVGLRYFNVFGPRQDPRGAYAAVIPLWARELVAGRPCTVYGDGATTRDFTWVGSVVQANLLAATSADAGPCAVFNVGSGRAVTLAELHGAMAAALRRTGRFAPPAVHAPLRDGDVRHSRADVSRITRALGYAPEADFERCMDATLGWYLRRLGAPAAAAREHAA
ncbi:MAG TPA: SDR family oxidoreductase [Longimicrobium sp.]|nr:SDR family oxidoreductase [Longimicrobium sp.]